MLASGCLNSADEAGLHRDVTASHGQDASKNLSFPEQLASELFTDEKHFTIGMMTETSII